MPVRYSDQSAGPSTRRAIVINGGLSEKTVGLPLDYAKMTRAELQVAAEAYGLPTSGTKADLIARLTA